MATTEYVIVNNIAFTGAAGGVPLPAIAEWTTPGPSVIPQPEPAPLRQWTNSLALKVVALAPKGFTATVKVVGLSTAVSVWTLMSQALSEAKLATLICRVKVPPTAKAA